MRFIKRIQPNEIKAEYLDGETIEFYLPNHIVNLSTFKVIYDGIADVYANVGVGVINRFLPRLSQSIIEELCIEINDYTIQIKDYNLLYNILNDGMKDKDDVYSNKLDTINHSFIDNNNISQSFNDLVNYNASQRGMLPNQQKYKYVISDWIGFLKDVKYLDCRNKKVKISIKLAPKYICYKGLLTQPSTPTILNDSKSFHYRLSNVFADIEIISADEGVKIENDVIYEDFEVVKGNLGSNKNTVLMKKHKGNIKYLLGTFTDSNKEGDLELQLAHCNSDTSVFNDKMVYDISVNNASTSKTFEINQDNISPEYIQMLSHENNLNNSIYFKRNGLNVKNSRFSINGQELSPYMGVDEIYFNAKQFMPMKRVKSLVSFQNEFFCHPMVVNQTDESSMNLIEWEVSADNKAPNGGTPYMFICYEKSLKL